MYTVQGVTSGLRLALGRLRFGCSTMLSSCPSNFAKFRHLPKQNWANSVTPSNKVNPTLMEYRPYTYMGGAATCSEGFINIFSGSSPGCWAVLQLPCCPSKQVELLENVLQNLQNTWPLNPVFEINSLVVLHFYEVLLFANTMCLMEGRTQAPLTN